jgi:hypothetical protein
MPPEEYASFDDLPSRRPPSVPPAALAPPRGLPDPHGKATRHMHMVWNDWEMEQLGRMARREAMTMTKLVRRIVRDRLLRDAKL